VQCGATLRGQRTGLIALQPERASEEIELVHEPGSAKLSIDNARCMRGGESRGADDVNQQQSHDVVIGHRWLELLGARVLFFFFFGTTTRLQN
jgi:hypothetical protein